MNKKKILSYIVILLLLSVFPFSSNQVGADSWTKYQYITVTNPDNGCQVFFNLSYDADMKADFGDVHFTKTDNTTELDYWMEKKVNSDYAWFWVELPSDIESDAHFVMQYGDASSTTLSNGANTFEWFDDFTDNVTHTWESAQGSETARQWMYNDTGLTLTTNFGVHIAYNISDEDDKTDNLQLYFGVVDDDIAGNNVPQNGSRGAWYNSFDSNSTHTDTRFSGYIANADYFDSGGHAVVNNPFSANQYKLHYKVNSTRYMNYTYYNYADLSLMTNGDGNDPSTWWSNEVSFPNVNCHNIYFYALTTTTHTFYHTTIDDNGYVVQWVHGSSDDMYLYADVIYITEEPDTPPSLSFGGEGERGDASFSCSETSHEYGSWEKSEKVLDGTLDEAWTNDSQLSSDWYIYDRATEWGGNYSYSYNGEVGGMNVSFLDSSGVNRSQIVMNVHLNTSNNVTVGTVIQDCDGNQLYFLIGDGTTASAYILYYNATTETYFDVGTRGVINVTNCNMSNLSNWASTAPIGWIGESEYDWTINMTSPDGVWIKLLTNPFCECYKWKFWGNPTYNGLMYEPANWVTEYCEDNPDWDLMSCNLTCVGVAVWNRDTEKDFRADFDLISEFQENSSLNSSATNDLYPDGKPFMEFPIVNSSLYYDNLTRFFNDAFSGNISQEYLIPYLINITNSTNKESRPYTPDDSGSLTNLEQNDTVRYHSAFLTNATGLGFDYNNYLWIYTHFTPYGETAFGDEWCAVALDLPPVGSWQANDRLFYVDMSDNKYQWDGHAPATLNANLSAWFTDRVSYQNIYRYYDHAHFNFYIPQAELVDGSGNPLNTTHVFNLTILTGSGWDSNTCVWNNYNETACDSYTTDEKTTTVKPFFLNMSYFDGEADNTINDTCSNNWGQGQITGSETLGGDELTYSFTVDKTVNETAVSGEHEWYPLNYSVTITNTGTGPLTDIYVNETWHECGCSDFNWSIVSTSLANSTYDTWHNDSCYWTIHNESNEPLTQGNTWTFWCVMNVSMCADTNLTGYVYNNVTVNASEVGTDQTDSVYTLFGVQASRVRITGDVPYPDILDTGNSVFSIIGIVLIIGSILLIVGIARKYGMF